MGEKRKIQAVIFDLDGTLLDTISGITASVNAALARFGCSACSQGEVRSFVGNGLRRTLALAIPGGEGHPNFETALAFLLTHYEAHCDFGTHPYPGVQALLASLRASGYKLAVVSNKTDPAVQALRARYFPDMDAAIGEQSGLRRKPAPDGVLAVMAQLGLRAESCVYVGDSEVDLKTARNAGLPCISVLWGYRDRTALLAAGAKYIAESTADIPALLDRLGRS